MNDNEIEKLREIIEKFGSPGGLGPKLQLYLLEQQRNLDNWVTNFKCLMGVSQTSSNVIVVLDRSTLNLVA